MKVVVIDYNAGNVQSVLFALEKLGYTPVLSADHAIIRSADKVIFPGVGEASTTMRYLRERGLDEVIIKLTQPVLAICLGMQLLCNHSAENDTACLGIMPMQVKKFQTVGGLKVPHMGWNDLTIYPQILPLNLTGQYVYFVHSYYVEEGPHTAASAYYGVPFSAMLRKDNFLATQFHPEKSGSTGMTILKYFLDSNA